MDKSFACVLLFSVFLISACGGGSGVEASSTPPAVPPVSEPVIPAPAPDPPQEPELYFPPTDSEQWQATSLSALNWNSDKYQELITHLQQDGTRAFIVLKDGKIVIEEYFGLTLNEENPFDETRNWYWASAGKTLTSFMLGIAQEQGLLSIDDSSALYLGSGWGSLSVAQEEVVTIWHHLTMTTGLQDDVVDDDCTLSACLIYHTEPGQRWAYHNAPYTLLTQVIQNASGLDFRDYFNQELRDKIGMNGFWLSSEDSFNETYYSTARSMARFGLLMLNGGNWDGEAIMADSNYFNAMSNTSQTLNPAYGYLWWLNGKSTFMVPATGQRVFDGALSPDAPMDMYAAMGRDGQLLNVVPSENLVVVRMGESTEDTRVTVRVQNNIWEILRQVIAE